MKNPNDIAKKLLGSSYDSLDERAKNVARHVAKRQHIAKNPSQELDEQASFGQRAADAVASFGGSWTFISIFVFVLIGWVILNSVVLRQHDAAFDPYPYILLNLFLSMLAAIQAPIILMSQNRQTEKDRLNAEHDYEVNLKAELEIMLLHEKIDLLREQQWSELLEIQKRQLLLLETLSGQNNQNDDLKPRMHARFFRARGLAMISDSEPSGCSSCFLNTQSMNDRRSSSVWFGQ